MVRTVALLALAASATAFAPQQQAVRGASSLSACAAGVSLFRLCATVKTAGCETR